MDIQKIKEGDWGRAIKCGLSTGVVAFFLYYVWFFTSTEIKVLFEGGLFFAFQFFLVSSVTVRVLIWYDRALNW